MSYVLAASKEIVVDILNVAEAVMAVWGHTLLDTV